MPRDIPGHIFFLYSFLSGSHPGSVHRNVFLSEPLCSFLSDVTFREQCSGSTGKFHILVRQLIIRLRLVIVVRIIADASIAVDGLVHLGNR